MDFITNEDYRRDVRQFVKSNIKKRVIDFQSETSYAPEFIAQRYLKCLELSFLPSKCVFMDYLNLSEKEKFNPDIAARACEFYGGIFYKQFEENPKEIFKLEDIALRLKMSYSHLTYINPIFADLFYHYGEILATFRQTTDRFANGRLEEERILRFHH